MIRWFSSRARFANKSALREQAVGANGKIVKHKQSIQSPEEAGEVLFLTLHLSYDTWPSVLSTTHRILVSNIRKLEIREFCVPPGRKHHGQALPWLVKGIFGNISKHGFEKKKLRYPGITVSFGPPPNAPDLHILPWPLISCDWVQIPKLSSFWE